MSDIFKRYLTTKEACIYLSCHRTFLHNRKGRVFFKGIHYVIPAGETRFLRWDRLELDKWIHSISKSKEDKEVDEILNQIL